jgi:hypothetical protein
VGSLPRRGPPGLRRSWRGGPLNGTVPDYGMVCNAMTKRIGLDLRVSTKNGQTIDNQRQALNEAIGRRPGWVIAEEFADEGISGAKGRDKQPEFDRLLKQVVRRKIDVVAAWSVDRLGRSLQDLVGFPGELNAAGRPLSRKASG